MVYVTYNMYQTLCQEWKLTCWFCMQDSMCGIWYASILEKFVGHSISHEIKWGFIDVGDGCWRHLVLMTSLKFWWPIWNVGDWSHKIMQFERCLKHLFLNGRRHNVRSDVRILNSDITESRLILNIPSRSPNGKNESSLESILGLNIDWSRNLRDFPHLKRAHFLFIITFLRRICFIRNNS